MATRCQICLSKHLTEISDLLDSNTMTLKEISTQFGCSYPSLVRHAARHRGPAVPEAEGAGGTTGDDLQSRSDLLWSRSNEVWARSTVDADLRSQISSIQTGLRSLELASRQAEREAERVAGDESNDGRVILQELDAFRDNFFASGVRESEWEFIQILCGQFNHAVTYRADQHLFDLIEELLKLASPRDYAEIEDKWNIYRAFRLAEGDRIDLTRRGGDYGPFQSQTAN